MHLFVFLALWRMGETGREHGGPQTSEASQSNETNGEPDSKLK